MWTQDIQRAIELLRQKYPFLLIESIQLKGDSIVFRTTDFHVYVYWCGADVVTKMN